jgi:hypothetical protein
MDINIYTYIVRADRKYYGEYEGEMMYCGCGVGKRKLGSRTANSRLGDSNVTGDDQPLFLVWSRDIWKAEGSNTKLGLALALDILSRS